ncbi:MAG: peptidoglycan-binding domain-containing protein, partial [Oscillospiraceae bacterium]
TKWAVECFQRTEGLPQTGVVDSITWDALYQVFVGAERTLNDAEGPALRYPGTPLSLGQRDGTNEVIS